MLKARISPAVQYPFWFLYEGTPGGQLNPTTDFLVFSNGQQINAGQTRDGDLPDEEWAYVADPNVGTGRSIFLINHKDDTKNDTYFPDTSKVMTILGFGRSASALLMENNTAPREFTFGLMDETLIDNAKPIIYNAYRDLNTSVGNAEGRAGASLGTQNPVQFTITGEHTITAQFKPAQYTLTVGVNPPETGTVVKSPDKATYNFGEQVTLTAAPTAAGYNFTGWSGDAAGSANPVTVTVTKNMNVTASFAQAFTEAGFEVDHCRGAYRGASDLLVARKAVAVAPLHLRQEAATHRLDTGRIVLGGSSAGAIASLFTAYTEVEKTAADAASNVALVMDLWGGLYTAVNEMAAGEPPLIIIHGTADTVVPYSEAQKLRARAEAVDIPHAFHPLQGEGHAPYKPAELMVLVADFAYDQLWPGGAAPTVVAPTVTALPTATATAEPSATASPTTAPPTATNQPTSAPLPTQTPEAGVGSRIFLPRVVALPPPQRQIGR